MIAHVRVFRKETEPLAFQGGRLHARSRRVHDWSERTGPFAPINCAALPKALAAAELLGHVRRAFSGTHADRTGVIASADRGTVNSHESRVSVFDYSFGITGNANVLSSDA
jgi:transcriptional regulator of acetoin/glycerol metabolism